MGEDTEDTEDQCEHVSKEKDWLALLKGKEKLTLAPHPYCENCGLVRNIGPDRPRKMGFYVDALNELQRYLREESKKGGKPKLIEAQKRLIVKEMQKDDLFQDLYGTLASAQKERFIELVQKYRPDLKSYEIEFYLE
ncbi:MAG: hypothetical protein ACOCT7_01500 [Candidatus Saliniplasma sp.]